MTIRILNRLPEDDWRSFIMGHPEANVFHTPEMFQVFERTKGHRPELWAALEEDQILALMTPVRIHLKRGPFLRSMTTRSVIFGSILCAPERSDALSQLLSAYVRDVRHPPLFTELRNVSDLRAFLPTLHEQGFMYKKHLNYLVDLSQAPSELFRNIGSRTRKNIRHALNRDRVKLEVLTDKNQLAVCYDLLRLTYRKARVPLADQSLFEAAFDVLGPKNMVRFTLARVGPTPVAVSVDLIFKDVIYGWYGGTDRAFQSYVPNELLTWSILRWGAENGCRTYDFGGAGDPDLVYGVRDFKAKFGGQLVCYGRNTYVHSKLKLSLSMIGYKILRHMFFGGH